MSLARGEPHNCHHNSHGTIDLNPGEPVPKSNISIISSLKQAIVDYVAVALKQSYISPSTFQASSFFFVAKNDMFWYALPFVPAALERLCRSGDEWKTAFVNLTGLH